MIPTVTQPLARDATDYFTLLPIPLYSHDDQDHHHQLSRLGLESPAQSPTSTEYSGLFVTTPSPSSTDSLDPLPAIRLVEAIPSPVPAPTASVSLLQMQTAAAHGQSARPRPYPVQNVLHVTSDGSSCSSGSDSSSHSSMSGSPISSLDLARCSRCQRTPSMNIGTGKSNMVPYGLNLWYCSRCAALVGLNR